MQNIHGSFVESRILVVDDDPDICRMVRAALEEDGYRVWTAHSGPDALRLIAEQGLRLQLLLTDVRMPRMNGPALADAVLRERPGTPVLFMSGSPGAHWSQMAGILLPKPFSVAELLMRVRTLTRTPLAARF